MISINQNLNTINSWSNKLDFFIRSSSIQPEKSTLTSVALKNLPQPTENKKDIISQTVSVWQSWKNGDDDLKEKALAIFLSLHEEYLDRDTPLEALDEMMSEWQTDPALSTNIARNLEKNNPTLFKELHDQKLVFSVRIGETGENRLYSKALLEKNAPYLLQMIEFGGVEYDPNTGILTLQDDEIFKYMLENLESSLIDDPSERKKEQTSKAFAFIDKCSVDDLIMDVFEYNLVSVKDALVNLVGDYVLNPTDKSCEFLQKARNSESLLIPQAAELKERMVTLDKALTSLKNKPYFDLSKSRIHVSTQEQLDEIIKDIEKITGVGYPLHINKLLIQSIEDLTSINLNGLAENVEIKSCKQLRTIHGIAKTWILTHLDALTEVNFGQAENVKIWSCKQLETIQGTAKKTWSLMFLDALTAVNFGQAENVEIWSCKQLKTIKGTAKTWELVYLGALTAVNFGQAENVLIVSCKQLGIVHGTAKTWKLEDLDALTTVDLNKAEKTEITNCPLLK